MRLNTGEEVKTGYNYKFDLNSGEGQHFLDKCVGGGGLARKLHQKPADIYIPPTSHASLRINS